MARIEIGDYIVSDSRVCGGRLTFRGTRVFVQDVVEMLRHGVAVEEIVRQWHNLITPEAVEEARSLVGEPAR
jgi:uncharacterized protein (DUF433 family)